MINTLDDDLNTQKVTTMKTSANTLTRHPPGLALPPQRLYLNAGEVALIGTGPGDAELLTLRALRILQEAQVIVYDRLVDPSIMALIPAGTEKIYVGKRCGHHSMPQGEINTLLIHHAQRNRKVVRLKGGDPFVFGRGGEEVETLLNAGVSCFVVPGITSASACATYADIPLTHRDCARGCTFITGHLKDGELELPWAQLAREDHTLVIYMGLFNAPVICRELIAQGMDRQIAAAIIENGTTAKQRTLRTTLEQLPECIKHNHVQAPAILIIGKVVSLFADKILRAPPLESHSHQGRALCT